MHSMHVLCRTCSGRCRPFRIGAVSCDRSTTHNRMACKAAHPRTDVENHSGVCSRDCVCAGSRPDQDAPDSHDPHSLSFHSLSAHVPFGRSVRGRADPAGLNIAPHSATNAIHRRRAHEIRKNLKKHARARCHPSRRRCSYARNRPDQHAPHSLFSHTLASRSATIHAPHRDAQSHNHGAAHNCRAPPERTPGVTSSPVTEKIPPPFSVLLTAAGLGVKKKIERKRAWYRLRPRWR